MKRVLSYMLIAGLLLICSACAATPTVSEPVEPPVEQTPVEEQGPPAPPEPFPGKIAIITSAVDCDVEPYHSAQQMVKKYGSEKMCMLLGRLILCRNRSG